MALLQVLKSGQGVKKTTIMMTMAMAAAMVMAGQRGQVGLGQCVEEDNASTKAIITMTMARTSKTKEMDWNLIPPGDTALRNGTNSGGGRALDNDDMEYNNAGPGDGGLASMINDKDD
jgi:hypothetical protein